MLVTQSRQRQATLLDEYGAMNLPEFFAVTVECFLKTGRDVALPPGFVHRSLRVF